MEDRPGPRQAPPGSVVQSADLQRIIQRAIELAVSEQEETLDAAEVVRIGEELGLPPIAVRRAILERSAEPHPAGVVDRLCGSATLIAHRPLEGDSPRVLDRVSERLAVGEYLRPRRFAENSRLFTPAEGWIASLLRAFRRRRGSHRLAYARAVRLTVGPLSSRLTHVTLEVDLSTTRRGALLTGAAIGGTLALAVGTAAAIPIIGWVGPGTLSGIAAGAAAAASVALAGVATGVALAVRRFRHAMEAARMEVEGMLDLLQLEAGGGEPPA